MFSGQRSQGNDLEQNNAYNILVYIDEVDMGVGLVLQGYAIVVH